MGNGPSRRRRSEPSIYATYPFSPGPVSYTPYVPPPRFPPPYQSEYNPAPHYYPPRGYHQSYHVTPIPNQAEFIPNASSSTPLPAGESSAIVPHQPAPQQQTVTVRNAVNINKGTIRLIKDEEHPGFYLLSFFYDADSVGSFDIFLFAKEDEKDCSIKPLHPNLFSPTRIPFEKGVAKTFQQAPGTGIYLDCFDSADLEKEGSDQVCPLVIRAQTSVVSSEQVLPTTVEDIGAALPKSANSQITQAVIQRKDNGDCKVQVLRQIIWVDGRRYELKELYGVENTVDQSEYNEDDFGKECVICMSEPRDTAVMPCRHTCMCSTCATSFKSQMNKCPICRQHVESLLKIKS